MKIALAQINSFVGDIENNSNLIIKRAKEASIRGAELFITPELSICGYPPEDLVLREDFLDACSKALKKIAKAMPSIKMIVGHPLKKGSKIYNAASLLFNGKIQGTYFKQTLPNYGVFDENRYFEPGEKEFIFTHKGLKIGLLICEDAWSVSPGKLLKKKSVDGIIVINASPYEIEKSDTRIKVIAKLAQETKSTVIYLNAIGGQDELIFDGGSFVVNKDAKLLHQSSFFKEETAVISIFSKTITKYNHYKTSYSKEAHLYEALKLALKDYVVKNNFKNLFIGLSGGIDSALVLALAYDTFDKKNITAVMMPSEFTAKISITESRRMIKNTGVNYKEISIQSIYKLFRKTLSNEFKNKPFDATEENLQARIRGVLLMALSNKFNGLVISTSNKSETAVGYSTLYGDMVGGFALLKDVPKTWVYRLAHYRNSISTIIPNEIIKRLPTAELRPNQLDQNSLPKYEILDKIIELYIEKDLDISSIVKKGFSSKNVNHVVKLINNNEFKRAQSPIGPKITHRAFGKDRRYPITFKH
ncbi:MAG: putative glutamine-dependent synthetase [Pseudomonadota bacterium]|jgi:NAD+ synthase (glutamine-hydrolysing)